MTISTRVTAALGASLLLLATPVFAQSTAAPAAKSDAAAPAAATSEGASPMMKNGKARSPESVECYKQADEKGLHGKERKKFHHACVKDAKAGTTKQ
jgi:hypothetical protein